MRMIALCCLGLLCLAGCNEPQQETAQPNRNSAQPPPQEPPEPPVGPSRDVADPRDGRLELDETEPGSESKERVKAEVGVGVKGRRLEDERLVQTIVTPAIGLFRTKERTVFEIQIPKAMQLYEALNGRKPKTEQEFFDQIITANQISLPELPEGHKYVYDAEKGELLVERPAR